jgi:copper(I)-binding protein
VNQRTKLFFASVASLALTFSLVACGSDDASSDTATGATTAMDGTTATGGEMAGGEATVGDISVTGAWVREPAEGQTNSAAYASVTNNGDADVTLVAASVPFGAAVEIHETTTAADGTMQMREVPEGFVVPAGGSFTLEPGGPHIMLIDIDPADITGTVELTLIFDDGTEVTVGAPVKALDTSGDTSSDMGGGMTGTTMPG